MIGCSIARLGPLGRPQRLQGFLGHPPGLTSVPWATRVHGSRQLGHPGEHSRPQPLRVAFACGGEFNDAPGDPQRDSVIAI
jgi:hypothetical protein